MLVDTLPDMVTYLSCIAKQICSSLESCCCKTFLYRASFNTSLCIWSSP